MKFADWSHTPDFLQKEAWMDDIVNKLSTYIESEIDRRYRSILDLPEHEREKGLLDLCDRYRLKISALESEIEKLKGEPK
jgi:hypothetical protein